MRPTLNPPRTPPAPSHDLTTQNETPSRPRQSYSSRYRAGHLSDARSVVIEDLGDIPLVSVEFFTSNVLPPIRDNILVNIKASLVAKKHIEENRWSGFPQSPKATGLVETQAFSAFPIMVDHIVQTASTFIDSKPTLEFVYKPNEAPVSERNNATRPDGQLELKDKKSVGEVSSSGEKSHWEDIVLPCEFKVDKNDYKDVCPYVSPIDTSYTFASRMFRSLSGVLTTSCVLIHFGDSLSGSRLKIHRCGSGSLHDLMSW